MTTFRGLVDPQLAPTLSVLRPLAATGPQTLPGLRAAIEAAARAQVAATDTSGLALREAIAPSPSGGVRVAVYQPAGARARLPALLHFHGGGLVMGVPEMRHEDLVVWAREVPCVVCSVQYRLAPEHPFPAAIDDAIAAVRWLHADADALLVDRHRIVVAGESAGGGLTAALALRVRDEGELRLRAQLLSYPMLDDRTTGHDPASPLGALVWGPDANSFAWSAYLPGVAGGQMTPALAAAARSERLDGLPPTFIGVGALDLFLDESLAYAARLARSGVPVEAHVYPGAFHGFDAAPSADVAARFRADVLAFLRRSIHP